jgi:hypothetical protein
MRDRENNLFMQHVRQLRERLKSDQSKKDSEYRSSKEDLLKDPDFNV